MTRLRVGVASCATILLLSGTASAVTGIPVTVVGTANVNVTNPVKITGDAAAATAVQAQNTCPQPCSTNHFADVTLYTVPAGKRLVIEHVSGFVTLPAGNVALYSLQTVLAGSFGGNHVDHLLTPNKQEANAVSISDALRLYADAGTSIVFHVFDVAGDGTIDYVLANFSGYLVDL
jgi:hypothetical protein